MEVGKINVYKNTKHNKCKCCNTNAEAGVYDIEISIRKQAQYIDLCSTHAKELATKILNTIEESN